jgi:o-succinylbenzoate synthase
MRVTRLEIVPFALPFRAPYVTARGRLGRRELLLVRLHTDAGPVGLGEAAPLALRGGPSLAQLAGELAGVCRPLLEGATVGWGRRPALIADCVRAEVPAQALAAIDVALLDLAGKEAGRPAWEMLGAARAEPVACNASLVAGEPADVARQALEWAGRGFDVFKLKAGMDGDVGQVEAVREALGAGARLRVDANGTWAVAEASERIGRMAAGGPLELVEQPVATLAEMAELRRSVQVPLAADESVVSPDDARRATEMGACEVATVKLAKAGGVDAALAVAREIPVYLSSALDGPVGIAAAAHAALALARSDGEEDDGGGGGGGDGGGDPSSAVHQGVPDPAPRAAPGLAHGLATGLLFEGAVALQEVELRGSCLVPGDAPGLGVEIDDEALERHRIALG